MKKIAGHLKSFFLSLDPRIFFPCLFFMALAVFGNYHEHWNRHIGRLPDAEQYLCWYLVFLPAFSFPYLLYFLFRRHPVPGRPFLALLLLAPALFAWKMVSDVELQFSSDPQLNQFWNHVIYWPYKLVVLSFALFLVWRATGKKQDAYGLRPHQFHASPYLLMLLIMVPLVAAASTQADFLAMYPKFRHVAFPPVHRGRYQLLYELAYGSDFFSIELFFRGFLVLAFLRWFGKDAILPMACFYCTIHFGKPLGECISSFFGGMILGVVTYHTRTIFGGLVVHLGIAWMMELGGYLGNL